MNVAYVDTSALVSIAFDEPVAKAMIRRLEAFDEIFSSNLLEAELLASLTREQVPLETDLLSWISWVLPDRPLTPEYAQVLEAGYLRGADLWHMACALYLAGDPRAVSFVTLDKRQRAVARKLGLDTRVRG
ncbi:MAG: PIN domain-containing protein [Gemmatimonadales bacterium]|jgi:predicted nucleic acid-binding protein